MKIIAEDRIQRAFLEIQRYTFVPERNATILAVKSDRKGYRIEEIDGEIVIDYHEDGDFFFALAAVLGGCYENGEERAPFVRLGLMADCARGAVPTVDYLKKTVVRLALTGYRYLELYVEDVLAVEDEPRMGYMRGKYSEKEIKELDEFCKLFGIELVPCIQTLAHCERILVHEEYADICDTGDILLVGEEKTYGLLERIFAFCARCFSSRNINIGMDEAMLFGLGAYRIKHGIRPRGEIFCEHLARVSVLAEKYGFTPSMWSDMFFREDELPIPQNVRLVAWDYYHTDEGFYDELFEKHKKKTNDFAFAGGAVKWSGFMPFNDWSKQTLAPALSACRKYGVNDFLLTAWGDNGAECSLSAVLPTIVYVSQCVYKKEGNAVADALCKLLTGYTDGELRTLDLPDRLYDGEAAWLNPTKYLLYEDVLAGLPYATDGYDYDKRLERVEAILSPLASRNLPEAYLFHTAVALCRAVRKKYEVTQALRTSYRNEDFAAVKACAQALEEVVRLVEAFHEGYRAQWKAENKPFGLEVHDYRMGGLAARIKCVRRDVLFAVEKGERVEALEAERFVRVSHHNNGCNLEGFFERCVTYGKI